MTPLTPLARTDPTFRSKVDAFATTELPNFVTEANALEANVEAKQSLAQANQTASAASAAAAQTSAASAQTHANTAQAQAVLAAATTLWVSGASYVLGQRVTSPSNGWVYRCILAGVSATDPATDATRWALVGAGLPTLVVTTATHNLASGTHAVVTGPACTLTLPAAMPDGVEVAITIANSLATNVVARNSNALGGITRAGAVVTAENMTLDAGNGTFKFTMLGGVVRVVQAI